MALLACHRFRICAAVLLLAAFALQLMLPTGSAEEQPVAPDVAAAEEEALWETLFEARRTYQSEPNDENLEAVLAAAHGYLEGTPRPGLRTEFALGIALQALELFERWAEVIELCDAWEPAFEGEQQSFRIALRVYRAKGHAYLGNVEEADKAVRELLEMRIDEQRLARFVQQALLEIEQTLKLRPGIEPPPFALPRLDDPERTVESEALLGEGRYVLLVFWASWCGKCRVLITEEIVPLKERLRANQGEEDGEKFQVVSIGLNWRDSAEAQRQAVDEMSATWLHLYDESTDVAESFGVRHAPFLVLLDGDGKIVHAGTAFRMLERIRHTLSERLQANGNGNGDDDDQEDDNDNDNDE